MPLWLADRPLVLASGSRTRAGMLEAAGIPVEIVPAAIDERGLEVSLAAAGAGPEAVALGLARAKALQVGRTRPGRHVLGADQTLACGDERFHKPDTRAAARAQLAALAGRTHVLHSAFALVRDGEVEAQACRQAVLTMRTLSGAFLDAYLDASGPAVTTSVGAYRVEELGAQLFERIEGEHATILGLPLLPLLDALRARGLLLS